MNPNYTKQLLIFRYCTKVFVPGFKFETAINIEIIKVKNLTKSTLCLMYFRNIVIVMTKGKSRKIKITKIYLFLLPPLPSQDGSVAATPPLPPTFFTAKISEKNIRVGYLNLGTVGNRFVWLNVTLQLMISSQ